MNNVNKTQALTDAERIDFLKKEEKARMSYASIKDTLQLIDLTQSKTITTSTYDRDSLRTYLKNPASETNQKNLRKLSNYLYTVSHVYRRLINFKATQIKCKSWTVYPLVSMTEENDSEAILTDYEKVCKIVDNMDMKNQILKVMLTAWKNDLSFGFTYGDPNKNGEFFIHMLPNDYCKISNLQYYRGVIGIAFDLSYFDSNTTDLEYWDSTFKKLYDKYKADSKQRWADLPIERCICIKINIDNLDYPIVPLSGMLDQIISLTDLQGIQDLMDEMQAYKMIWAKIDTISGSKDPDDFSIDLDLANDFYNKLQEALPDNVSLAMSPMDLQALEFKGSDASDSNIISDAYSNLIEANGGIVLNSNRITNSKSFQLALMCDSIDAMAPVEQINAWVNFYLRSNYKIENMVVEYSDVSPYFVDDKIDKLLKVAQYGLPIKQELASLINVNPIKSYGLDYLESQVLKLGVDRWATPLVSSNVQSGKNGDGSEGAPTKDDSELSADGIATRDDNKNDN